MPQSSLMSRLNAAQGGTNNPTPAPAPASAVSSRPRSSLAAAAAASSSSGRYNSKHRRPHDSHLSYGGSRNQNDNIPSASLPSTSSSTNPDNLPNITLIQHRALKAQKAVDAQRIMDLEKRNEDITASLATLQENSHRIYGEQEALQANYYRLYGENEALRANYDRLYGNFNGLHTERENLQRNYNRLNQEKKDLQECNNSLKEEKADLQRNIDQLTGEKEALRGNVDQLTADNMALEANIGSIQEREALRGALKKSLKDMKTYNDAGQAKKEAIEAENKAVESMEHARLGYLDLVL